MKTTLAILAVLLSGCGSDAAGPRAPEPWPSYASTTWTYQYIEPGYTEGLRNVTGVLVLSRSPTRDSLRITAPGVVQGTFWYVTTGDTASLSAVLWPNGFIYRATVTTGDTFTVVRSNAPGAWPDVGTYSIGGDSATFLWEGAYGVGQIFLRIVFRREQ